MILIGQYDSPFVRRVGIALTLYGLAFEHKPWSGFGDVEKIRRYNPLTRVPTLALDDGDVLIDSHAILDYLDGLVGPERAMFPAREPDRHRALKLAATASHLADKAVSLFYERRLHAQVSDVWVERCERQLHDGLSALEADCAALKTPYWFGARIGHGDVALVCALRFLGDVHPALFRQADWPALAAFSSRLEALPVFLSISQPFLPPA